MFWKYLFEGFKTTRLILQICRFWFDPIWFYKSKVISVFSFQKNKKQKEEKNARSLIWAEAQLAAPYFSLSQRTRVARSSPPNRPIYRSGMRVAAHLLPSLPDEEAPPVIPVLWTCPSRTSRRRRCAAAVWAFLGVRAAHKYPGPPSTSEPAATPNPNPNHQVAPPQHKVSAAAAATPLQPSPVSNRRLSELRKAKTLGGGGPPQGVEFAAIFATLGDHYYAIFNSSGELFRPPLAATSVLDPASSFTATSAAERYDKPPLKPSRVRFQVNSGEPPPVSGELCRCVLTLSTKRCSA